MSPGGLGEPTPVEARCPTFQWAGVAGADGYELAVFRVTTDEHRADEHRADEPVLVARASVPGDARGFTPSSEDCLERGSSYAWSVAVAGDEDDEGQLRWSTPSLFEIEAAPSLAEVERALATLRSYREHLRDSGIADAADEPAAAGPRTSRKVDRPLPAALRAPLVAPTSPQRIASAAAPALGSASLRIDDDFALGASSDVFKNDEVFLWDDASGNTALGRNALASAAGAAVSNTAIGRDALRDTTQGALEGRSNTAVGDQAMRSNTAGLGNVAVGSSALQSSTSGVASVAVGGSALANSTSYGYNTAVGYRAMYRNSSGGFNTAIGYQALKDTTTGSRNTAIGSGAGELTTLGDLTGSDSIFVGSGATAEVGDTNTIRIGGKTVGDGSGQQNRTFVNGIVGVTTTENDAIPVLVDSAGQLGTVSSSAAVKQDVEELGALARRLLELRPVAFRYKRHAAAVPDGPRQFGLIAEEVAEVFPELVVFDAESRPLTVKYHLLSSLLVGALQSLQEELAAQREELGLLRARLATSSSEAAPRSVNDAPGRPWSGRSSEGDGSKEEGGEEAETRPSREASLRARSPSGSLVDARPREGKRD